MRVLFAASEVAPFAKTGGLADVAGSLPLALAELGHDVRVVLPRYRRIDPARNGLKHAATFYTPLASWRERCDVLVGSMGPVPAWFVNKDIYFDRPELYRTLAGDYHDNAERFIFFSRAIPEICRVLDFAPDIIHCNDWQTGLVPLYLKKYFGHDPLLRKARTVFTIHNLGYQGIFWQGELRLTGLGWEDFTPQGIEFWGNMNFLKAGIVFSDAVTTVSETYSRDIRTAEGGHGLDGVLRHRSRDLYGIVNGIDTIEWDPARDRHIAKSFSAARPEGKIACREALRREVGLPASNQPLFGMVTRLTDQKGIDILLDAVPALMGLGCQLVILGTGDEQYHRKLSDAAHRYRLQMRVLLTYDDALARRIYAGSDLFLMPSRYEPCGLGQMHALRYGSVPLVRRTGGLNDTVADFHAAAGTGTGFLFNEYSAGALTERARQAIKLFHNKQQWKRLMRNGMEADFSWRTSAQAYEKLYQKILNK
ncbi:MAG: glycogen synthase GlgA [Nitrospiraceae bacterium]|nr:glycogen synthase GlgA [Nitrospiraceae bacterium]